MPLLSFPRAAVYSWTSDAAMPVEMKRAIKRKVDLVAEEEKKRRKRKQEEEIAFILGLFDG